MINYSTCAHVHTLHLISYRSTPPMSAIQTGQSHHEGMWSTRRGRHGKLSLYPQTLLWYFVPSCFSACVIVPSVPNPHPPCPTHLSLHHSARSSVGQFISLLSWHFHFGLLPRSHYIFIFQTFSWLCHLQRAGREMNKQVERPQRDSHGCRWIHQICF